MERIRCIIADDEPIARQLIQGYLKDLPHVEIVAVCKDAFEVVEVLRNEEVDLLILDINMPKLSGLNLIRSLRIRPAIIITTAYHEYAVEGFELSVTDYLLKPFSFDRFLQAILKVDTVTKRLPELKVEPTQAQPDGIFVKVDKRYQRIQFSDLMFAQSYGNYVKLFVSGKMVLMSGTLADFMNDLPMSFIQVHRTYIINFKQLKSVEGNRILLSDGQEIPVGKSYRKELIERIEKA